MIYLYNIYDMTKYWAPPFNNLLYGLSIFFKEKNILCDYLNNNVPVKNDIVIVISGVIPSEFSQKYNCKLIIINSESIALKSTLKYFNRSQKCLNSYINNPNLVEIWDYSLKNVNQFKPITSIPCYYVPITYLPSFENIFNNKRDKIYDIFLFGGMSQRRKKIIDELKKKGLNVLAKTCNRHTEFIDMVNKTKIVLIIHHYEDDLCIDYYRLFSLISSKIFTISEMPTNDQMDVTMNRLIFSDYNSLINTCVHYLNKTQKNRDKISEDLYNWWKTTHHMNKYIPMNNIISKDKMYCKCGLGFRKHYYFKSHIAICLKNNK